MSTTDLTIGGDQDENGCYTTAGYEWCAAKDKCYRRWEEDCTSVTIGGDRDKYGCLSGAGYTWCAAESKCYRGKMNVPQPLELMLMNMDVLPLLDIVIVFPQIHVIDHGKKIVL